GKDVFVEKPITLVSSEAKKLTELAEKSGSILQVGHIFRFDPASLWLRDVIAEGRFGQLKMLRARFSGFKRPRPDTGVTFADSHAIKAEEGAVHQLEFPPEEPLRAELAAFIDSVEKRTPSPVDGWAGFHAIRVVEAALESARTGVWVEIAK